ncbi:MAG: single-stranded DNA-binding protein [Ignavibacteria bacterium]|jgi:single-strand DNA-binding protein|nr:single-stranded DNA-binding protein [Ignavibacteria bacterium]
MAELKMPEINYVIIAGNLTKDPVCRMTTNNTPVVNFSIASNRKYKDSSNQWQEDVCYIGVVAWNKLAESCRDRLRKGSAVLVDGELQSRTWKNDDGNNRSIVEIKARRIQFLNKRARNGENGTDPEDIDIFVDDDSNGFSEDSFDKFLSNEESDLIKNSNS